MGPFLRLAPPTTPFLLSAVYWYTYFLKALNLADPATMEACTLWVNGLDGAKINCAWRLKTQRSVIINT